MYVKGFKLNRDKLAKVAARFANNDGDFYSIIPVLMHELRRDSCKYIGWAYEHEPDPRDGLLHLALVLVMEQGMDKEELERRELKHSIDPSIERALPHVLEGPDVWKLR